MKISLLRTDGIPEIPGVRGLADYCASKFGAFGFTESLRIELKCTGATGVRTTCVCPYYINTGMFDGVKTRCKSRFLTNNISPCICAVVYARYLLLKTLAYDCFSTLVVAHSG